MKEQLNYSIEYIAYSKNRFSKIQISKICSDNNILFKECNSKNEVTEYLTNKQKKSLIISAGNRYLFPKEIVGKQNLTIINFHNALLPMYKGRNAPTWAIFCGESESGATWHLVNEDVDAGGILWQKSCEISSDMKAYELSHEIMKLAFEGFQQIFADVLEDKIYLQSPAYQQNGRSSKIYYSYEIPSGGRFSLDDPPEYIYRLLRCTDYGLSNTFPHMKTKLPDGHDIEITSYIKIKKQSDVAPIKCTDSKGNKIMLALDSENVLIMKYKVG